MYPVTLPRRIEETEQQSLARSSEEALRAPAPATGPSLGRGPLSKLRALWRSYRRTILAGIAVALVLVPVTSSFVANTYFAPWQQSHAFWLLLLLVQLCFAIVVFVEDKRRQKADRPFQPSDQSMALAAASTSVGLWNWDLGSDKIQASEFCRDVLRLKPDEECSLHQFLDSVHAEDRVSLRAAIDDALRTGRKFSVDFRASLRERGMRWITVSGRIRLDKSQHPVGLAGVFLDITSRKEAEIEAAQQREYVTHLTRVRMIGALSGAVAHELNQPLSAIMSNAQAAQRMLSRRSLDVGELRSTIKDIIEDDSRAAQVIRHLRALLTKSEANFETVNLSEVVLETVELVRAELIERQIRMVTRFDAVLPSIKGDKIQLQQVFLNLILNAADSLMSNPSTNRELTLSAALEGSTVDLVCSDNGPGVPSEALTRLFEPFYTTKKHGLGLGLMISRAIVASHGGSLSAANNLDRGVAFHVKLPILKETNAA